MNPENVHTTIAITLEEHGTLTRALEHERLRRLASHKADGRTTLASRRRHLAQQRKYVSEHIDTLLAYLNGAFLSGDWTEEHSQSGN